MVRSIRHDISIAGAHSISCKNGKVYINGNEVNVGKEHPEEIEVNISVIGSVGSVSTSSGTVVITGSVNGSVKTQSGDVVVATVMGDVETMSGDVEAGKIDGNVSTMSGDVKNG